MKNRYMFFYKTNLYQGFPAFCKSWPTFKTFHMPPGIFYYLLNQTDNKNHTPPHTLYSIYSEMADVNPLGSSARYVTVHTKPINKLISDWLIWTLLPQGTGV